MHVFVIIIKHKHTITINNTILLVRRTIKFLDRNFLFIKKVQAFFIFMHIYVSQSWLNGWTKLANIFKATLEYPGGKMD